MDNKIDEYPEPVDIEKILYLLNTGNVPLQIHHVQQCFYMKGKSLRGQALWE